MYILTCGSEFKMVYFIHPKKLLLPYIDLSMANESAATLVALLSYTEAQQCFEVNANVTMVTCQ